MKLSMLTVPALCIVLVTSCQTTAALATNEYNPKVLDFVKNQEGLRLKPYYDLGGVLTIGYGHTQRSGRYRFNKNSIWTQKEAHDALVHDFSSAYNAVRDKLAVPLSSCQHAVLASWTYNVGNNAMRKSTLMRLVNSGDLHSVPTQLLRWVKVKKRTSRGLLNRRLAEIQLWKDNCK